MSKSIYHRGVVLGLLIAVGAFAIDMYIPGFAAIARDLRTDPGTVQLSMTSFFAALALGQVIYGPVSDAVGRRPPIFAGLGALDWNIDRRQARPITTSERGTGCSPRGGGRHLPPPVPCPEASVQGALWGKY